MQVVININDKLYKSISSGWYTDNFLLLNQLIAKGTPLPKGHDRLIEADSLIKTIEEKAKRLSNADAINGLCGAVALIFDAPTIIEKDGD